MSKISPDVDLLENKERFESALVRLKSMRSRVTELRIQCESLRKLQVEKPYESLVCPDCGKAVERGQEVTLKDSSGNPRSHYHRDCFKAIWASQNWRVVYSSPGFLEMSKKDP